MNTINDQIPADDPVLREALKRCSPATYYAACKFRATGDGANLSAVVLGVVERFVERERRSKLNVPPAALCALRLAQDLGLDSLTMMEIVMLAEEVLGVTISNEELTQLRTLGDVQAFIVEKVEAARSAPATALKENSDPWDVATACEDVHRIEAAAGAPSIHRLPQ